MSTRAIEELAKRSQYILFSCKSGGCNGFEYVLEPCNPLVPGVEKQQIAPNVTLYTCNTSMLFLLGTKIDWSEDIMGSRFILRIQMHNRDADVARLFQQVRHILTSI